MTPKPNTRHKAPAAAAPPSPAPPPVPPPPMPMLMPIGGKLGILAALLRRPDGATVAQLADATGWKENSVRGAMAGALKARGLLVSSKKVDGGTRVYRLAQPLRVVLDAGEAQA